ncbi:MAG TPA: YraN family protein [Clostridia bacterium]|nr:YraN family protein [Clostridia bacterium]
MNKRSFGSMGEQMAADYLARNGFRILARNYRSGRFGEVDIIATEKEYICFIEVKTRTSDLFGTPAEAVGYSKRNKLRSLAWTYLNYRNLGEQNMRFDIVEVTGKIIQDNFILQNINLIRSAF